MVLIKIRPCRNRKPHYIKTPTRLAISRNSAILISAHNKRRPLLSLADATKRGRLGKQPSPKDCSMQNDDPHTSAMSIAQVGHGGCFSVNAF